MSEIYQKLKIYVLRFFRGRKKEYYDSRQRVHTTWHTLFFQHFSECLSSSNFPNVISIISKFLELLGAERKF